jgi:protein-tyrosine phosphatase
MEPWIKWVSTPELPGRVAITRRPRGGEFLDRDIATLRDGGLTMLVSLLAEAEALELGLDRQGDTCRAAGLAFVHVPVRDFGVPGSFDVALAAVDQIAAGISQGGAAGFHCYASRGRSPTLAACTLVRLGLSSEDAIARLSTARGMPVPETETQHQWIAEFETRVLRRNKEP